MCACVSVYDVRRCMPPPQFYTYQHPLQLTRVLCVCGVFTIHAIQSRHIRINLNGMEEDDGCHVPPYSIESDGKQRKTSTCVIIIYFCENTFSCSRRCRKAHTHTTTSIAHVSNELHQNSTLLWHRCVIVGKDCSRNLLLLDFFASMPTLFTLKY